MEAPTPDRAKACSASDCLWIGEQEDPLEYVTKALQGPFPKIIPEEVIKMYFGNQIQGYKYFVKDFDTNEKEALDELSRVADNCYMKSAKILQKRLVERLIKKYDVDSAGLTYPRPVSNDTMSHFLSSLDEATVFLLHSGLNVSIRDNKSPIRDPVRCANETRIKSTKKFRRQEEYAKSKREAMSKFMEKLLENEDMCRATLSFINKKIRGIKFDDKDLRKEEEENQRYRSSVKDVISSDRRSLLSMTNTCKSKLKNGFIEEHCFICLEMEKELEKHIHIDSEPLTAKDAKKLHTLLVRSGGMRNLVDFFKKMLKLRVVELVSPMFIGSLVPQDDGNLHKSLANYIKVLIEEMN